MRITVPLIKEKVYELLTSDTVGFSRIPEQARKMSVENGFSLNLLVIGRRGSGTRTLVNNLFLSPILNHDRPNELSTTCAQVTENGVKLNLRISTCHEFHEKNIVEYMKSVNFSFFESSEGLSKELKNDQTNTDKRVHLCIFLLPTDNLLPDELKLIKTISEMTNLLCVIGKADTYMDNELRMRKEEIKALLEAYQINTFKPSYEFETHLRALELKNQTPDEADAQTILTNETIQRRNELDFDYPFATIASENVFKINGQARRGRLYKWGFVDVNDTSYSDFLILRRVIIGSNMEEIKDVFERNFYESYRLSQLDKKSVILKFRAEKIFNMFSEWQKFKNFYRNQSQNEIIKEEKEDIVTAVE